MTSLCVSKTRAELEEGIRKGILEGKRAMNKAHYGDPDFHFNPDDTYQGIYINPAIQAVLDYLEQEGVIDE